jgi:enoyl-CoA hydratase/carnithine racemase
MKTETLTVDRKEHLATVFLNRPESMNALSTLMAKELIAVFSDLGANREVWTVILTGTGDKAFCAGADLKERKGMDLDQMRLQRELFVQTFKTVSTFPKPLIAAVNGYAFGGGFEFALGCDLIYAADNAVFSLPEVWLGIIPAGGGTQNLPRLVSPALAKELIFTGKRLSAREAEELGIVRKVTTAQKLLEEAELLGAEIMKNSPLAVWQAKKAINLGLNVDLYTGFTLEAECYNVCLKSADRDEGLKAFNEKRKPVFTGQ